MQEQLLGRNWPIFAVKSTVVSPIAVFAACVRWFSNGLFVFAILFVDTDTSIRKIGPTLKTAFSPFCPRKSCKPFIEVCLFVLFVCLTSMFFVGRFTTTVCSIIWRRLASTSHSSTVKLQLFLMMMTWWFRCFCLFVCCYWCRCLICFLFDLFTFELRTQLCVRY